MDILVRKFNDELYRRLKAEAAARGYTVAKALEEAATYWLNRARSEVASEMEANNEGYEALKGQLFKEHRGKYAVFCEGKLAGLADSVKGAGALVRKAGAGRALVVKVGEAPPPGGEWLWSSLESFAA